MNWSPQQAAIFDWFKAGTGNLVVRARAGTGKTTTIVEGVGVAPETSILLAAFNKKISTELQHRITGGAEAKTLHAIGFGCVRRYWAKVQIEGGRGFQLAKRAAGEHTPDDILTLIAKIASLGKNVAPFADDSLLARIAIQFDKTPDEQWEDEGYSLEVVCAFARQAMDLATMVDPEGERIDFDDMIYVPLVNDWVRPRYDLVVIDEAQDMNASQLMLARGVASGRIAVVGDDRQAIYGFRGADSNAIDNLKKELSASELGLTVTYRCARVIVDYAKRLVPDFVAHETNALGSMISQKQETMLADAAVGDFILSRKNSPLVPLCLRLLRTGKRARIEGRDIGAQLIGIVKARKARGLPALEEKMIKWRDKEIAKARQRLTSKAAVDDKVQAITDQYETIMALCDGVSTVPELLTRIERLFGDTPPGGDNRTITLSSIHKAKGLEADRVYVLSDTLYPGGDKTKIEEQNLEYVAVTRAKRMLVMVTP